MALYHRRSCLVSGTPIWTARQTVCFSPPGCPSGYVNLPSRYNLPLPVRQYSLPHIVARQWGRVSSPTTLAMSLCHSGNAPFAHMRKRCKASCSDPPSRPHTFLQLVMCCLCHVFLGRSSTVLDAVPNAIALFSHCPLHIFEGILLGTPRVAVTALARCESGALCGSIAAGL